MYNKENLKEEIKVCLLTPPCKNTVTRAWESWPSQQSRTAFFVTQRASSNSACHASSQALAAAIVTLLSLSVGNCLACLSAYKLQKLIYLVHCGTHSMLGSILCMGTSKHPGQPRRKGNCRWLRTVPRAECVMPSGHSFFLVLLVFKTSAES